MSRHLRVRTDIIQRASQNCDSDRPSFGAGNVSTVVVALGACNDADNQPDNKYDCTNFHRTLTHKSLRFASGHRGDRPDSTARPQMVPIAANGTAGADNRASESEATSKISA
jgi:hypothetical protein